jgi:hypothetical protein
MTILPALFQEIEAEVKIVLDYFVKNYYDQYIPKL